MEPMATKLISQWWNNTEFITHWVTKFLNQTLYNPSPPVPPLPPHTHSDIAMCQIPTCVWPSHFGVVEFLKVLAFNRYNGISFPQSPFPPPPPPPTNKVAMSGLVVYRYYPKISQIYKDKQTMKYAARVFGRLCILPTELVQQLHLLQR